jgi:uncharacterized membrane protein YdfJ with MMPL/SSD domain
MMPKNVTIGSVTVTSPTIQQPQANTIATTTAQRYLNLSTQWIDSRLRGIYICPLRRMKVLETELIQNIPIGTNYLMVEDSGNFNLDSMVRITDSTSSETYTVNEIFDNDRNKMGITPATTRAYNLTNNPVVNLIEYPDPIPLITAQIAIGMMFDKIFSTQQPDLSNFGKAQRTQGSNAIDDILQGIIRLDGQDQTGRRFARSSLRDTISTTVELQHSRDKEV